MNPTVSFVVPCYRLAHLLAECVNSILSQSYEDLEILIMDDCSPDNTAEVAQAFRDPRVKYIRNESNLGHLRNYNKGIGLCKGKYVWLISADDCLRRPDALERYVSVMESNSRIGYAFSPAVRLENGVQGEVLDYSVFAAHDAVYKGREFLHKLVKRNTIVAPSVLVRKECYDRISLFPLDMPWGGDWYLWCVFALECDVAYFAEPMVCYRRHTLSMTNQLTTKELDTCVAEDVAMPWIIKQRAQEAGYDGLTIDCLNAAAEEYARNLTLKRYRTATTEAQTSMTFQQMESSLDRQADNEQEKRWVRARVYAGVADAHCWNGHLLQGFRFYFRSLRQDFRMPKVWLKIMMLLAGDWGMKIRSGVASHRRATRTESKGPVAANI